jgi:hypothetical protein
LLTIRTGVQADATSRAKQAEYDVSVVTPPPTRLRLPHPQLCSTQNCSHAYPTTHHPAGSISDAC